MKRRTPTAVGSLLGSFLSNDKNLNRCMLESRAVELLKFLAGQNVAEHITRVAIVKGRMVVFMDSSVAKNELFMSKDYIRDSINNNIGSKIVNDIIIR